MRSVLAEVAVEEFVCQCCRHLDKGAAVERAVDGYHHGASLSNRLAHLPASLPVTRCAVYDSRPTAGGCPIASSVFRSRVDRPVGIVVSEVPWFVGFDHATALGASTYHYARRYLLRPLGAQTRMVRSVPAGGRPRPVPLRRSASLPTSCLSWLAPLAIGMPTAPRFVATDATGAFRTGPHVRPLDQVGRER